MEISESTADKLEDLAERAAESLDTDVTLEEVQDEFKEQHEEVSGSSEGLPDEKVERIAYRKTRTAVLSSDRMPTEDVELLTVGGEIRESDNGEWFSGTAVLDDSPDEDGGMTRLCEVVVYEGELIHEMYDGFDQVGNVVRGDFSVSDADIGNQARVFSDDGTEIDVTRPDDRDELVEEVRDHVDEVTIENIADNLSGQTRNEDGDMYTVNSDIRRLEGDIYDGYKNPDAGNGAYTIRDDTVFDEEDIVDSSVYDEESANENATPGMTCWCDPNKMEFGSESICEFFGTVTQSDDGEVMMNVHGIVPVYVEEYDGYVDESSESSVPSQEQVDTSNVDRTEI